MGDTFLVSDNLELTSFKERFEMFYSHIYCSQLFIKNALFKLRLNKRPYLAINLVM